MSKKKRNRSFQDQKPNVTVHQGPDILYLLFMGACSIFLILCNIFLILRITSNQAFQSFHAPLQIPAYLIIFNTVLLLFLNENKSFLSKKQTIITIALAGLSLLYLYILSFYPVLELNGDNATYIARAQSMLAGRGFRNLWLPKEAYDPSLKSIGFSILNMPFLLIFGLDNYIGLKLLEFLSVFAGLYFMYHYFVKRTEKGVIFLLLASVALYPQIVHFSSIIMTESPSFFLMFLSLFAFDRVFGKEKDFNFRSVLLVILMALLGFFVFTVREALISLSAGTGIYLLIRKEWKKAIIFGLVFALLFLGYQEYSGHLKNLNQAQSLVDNAIETNTSDSFFTVYARVLINSSKHAMKNIWGSLLVLSQKLIGDPDRSNYDRIFPNLLALLVIGWGIFSRIRKKLPLLIYELLGIVLIAVVLLTWQLKIDPVVFSRYFYPLIPLIIYYAYSGISSALERFPRIRVCGLALAFTLFFTFLVSMNVQKAASVRNPYHPAISNFIQACSWIRENTPEDTIIATRKSSLSYIWAKRKSLHYFDIESYTRYDNQYNYQFATNTINYYNRSSIDYIILDAFSLDAYNKILPLIKANPNRFKVIYSTANPQNYVLEVIHQ